MFQEERSAMELVAAVQKTIHNHALFAEKDLVLVAVSGGPDSTALLHALYRLGYNLHAAHLNHSMRGEEADADAEYIKQFCDDLRIPITSEKRDVPAVKHELKLSKQVAARLVRYEFLENAAKSCGATHIATAHNRDDRIETMLLNMIRGSGSEGLRGIPYRRGIFVRPLLDVSRVEVESYCDLNNIIPRIDSSNNSPAYSRNNVRRELLPYLERRYNESVRDCLARLSQIAAEESDYLQSIASNWLTQRGGVPVSDFVIEPAALQRRILREYMRTVRDNRGLVDISHDTIERIRLNARFPLAITLPGGDWLAIGDGTSILLRRNIAIEEPPHVEMPIALGAPTQFLDWNITILHVPDGVEPDRMIVRTWKDGDRIKTSGGTKKLQDVFTNAKTPRIDRKRWPIIEDSAGIIAAPGLALALRAKGMEIDASRLPNEYEVPLEA
jgi:tRNA(Ile)-lysidine synthase